MVLVAEQLVYELLKQWTACHPCYSSCVFSCIKIHLRLNYALYFHFFLRGLTFKCIITDQSPKLDNINTSFLAICKEITSSTILERENEIYNEAVIQSLWQICWGLVRYFNPFNLVLENKLDFKLYWQQNRYPLFQFIYYALRVNKHIKK